MSPFEYLCAAYRRRQELAPQLLTLLALGVILTNHAITSPILDWTLN